jgi:hypothetical protein
MARPLGQVLCNAAGQTSTLPVATTSCPAVRIVRYERQHVLTRFTSGQTTTRPATSTRWSSATKHCESTSARGTAIWRSRHASGSLSSFYMGLTTFTAKASCIAEDVGRVSGHAEHQRGVGDENFLGVDALAAAVGEGDVERGGRRGLVPSPEPFREPDRQPPRHAGFRSAERTALFPNGPYLPYLGSRPTRPTKPTKPIQEDGWMGHPCRK